MTISTILSISPEIFCVDSHAFSRDELTHESDITLSYIAEAQIEYVGKFADASGGAAQKTEVAPAAKQEAKPNSDADAISKGLSGLK